VRFDRLAAGRQGLTVNDLQDRLHSLVEGTPVGIVVEDGRRVPLVMRGNDELRVSAVRLQNQVLQTPAGNSVTLAQLARIERSEPRDVDAGNGHAGEDGALRQCRGLGERQGGGDGHGHKGRSCHQIAFHQGTSLRMAMARNGPVPAPVRQG